MIRLLLLGLLAAPGAGAAELKLATWDLGWLTQRPAGDPALPPNARPKTAEDLALLAGYAEALRADIVALQGVDTADAARAVFPADRYDLVLAGDTVLQHAGFAVRRGLAVTRHPDVTELDRYPDARLHLRAGADISVTVGARTLRLLSVHLKSGCRDGRLDAPDRPACATLLEQAGVLRDWVGRAAAGSDGFAVLGDFGRSMEDPDDLSARIAGSTRLIRASAGHASPCWGPGPFVDDLLIGGAAADWVQAGSLRVMVFHQSGAEWRARLSSHCPVSVRLALPD